MRQSASAGWLLVACVCACGGDSAQHNNSGAQHGDAGEQHSDAGVRGGVPDGCEDVLIARSGSARCVSDTRCDAIRQQPERKVSWTLFVDTYSTLGNADGPAVSDRELTRRAQCLIDDLEAAGVHAQRSNNGENVLLEASYAQLEDTLKLAVVQGYEVTCVDSDCERCASFDEKQCRADAFCAVLTGHVLGDGCYRETFAGCASVNIGCSGGDSFERDGTCWDFPGCVPPDWKYMRSTTCTYEKFVGLDECKP